MPIHVHRCARTYVLVAQLADILSDPLRAADGTPDPLLAEVISVPTRGVERFLTQQLSQHLGVTTATGGASSCAIRKSDGVCANVDFAGPGELMARATAQALGLSPDSRLDPWRPDRLAWTLLDLIQHDPEALWNQALRSYLQGPDGSGRQGRHLHLSRKVAALFHRYGTERPSLIRAWAAGDDTDGFGGTVPPGLVWQPALWRAARTAIGTRAPGERLSEACQALTAEPGLCTLPGRLSVFGPTRISGAHRQLLGALAKHRDVHLWIPDPSAHRWASLATARVRDQGIESDVGVPMRAASPVPRHTRSPLLRSLGRDSGELAWLVQDLSDTDTDSGPAAEPSAPAVSLLGALQTFIGDDLARPPGQVEPDNSVQIHDCHGRPRQVEVLRESLLTILQHDQTLEPRDILIMCPDVAGYAPLITAAFSAGDPGADDPAAALRIRIADRTAAQHNDVLLALDQLLVMAGGRFPASAVLDFAGQPAVRRMFGFDDEALERLNDLAAQAHIRWGLDASDRTRFGLPPDVVANTWAYGVDRLLLGVAMGDDDLQMFGHVLPAENVSSGDASVITSLAELVDRLRILAPQLRAEHSVTEWTELLSSCLRALTAGQGEFAWQLPAALGALAQLRDEAGDRPFRRPDRPGPAAATLDLDDLRIWLADLLAGRPTRTNFRTGGVTVCSLAPMRSVPYRVICLLGLDDGVFPRRNDADGDDLLAHEPHIGERDAGAEDRQLFLDAIMAATQHVLITYAGRDVRTNRTQPPSVPVGEVLDALSDITGRVPADLVVRHPLQPFDPANFRTGTLVAGAPFSHDRTALAGARALTSPRLQNPPLFHGALPGDDVTEMSVADLTAFLSHPPDFFLRRRLGLYLERDAEQPTDQIPVELGGLDRWKLGDRILTGLLRSGDHSRITRAEAFRGELPPGALARAAFDDVARESEQVAVAAQALRRGAVREVPVSIALPCGLRLTGVVPDVDGDRLVEATFSALRHKNVLGLWVRLLALQVTQPNTECVAALVTRRASGVRTWTFEPVPTQRAADELNSLVDLMLRGRCEPLPVMPDASRDYAHKRQLDEPGGCLAEVRLQWVRDLKRVGSEANDRVVRRLWGDDDAFDRMCALPPRPDEADWFPAENSRFGVLARRIWDAPLAYGSAVSPSW